MKHNDTRTATVASADGTALVFDRTGDGPPLVLVVGAFCTRRTTKALTPLLAEHFTVFEYDRRGRGESGNNTPFAVEREVEDLAAVIGAAGGSAALYGHSSGAVLSLLAAASDLGVTRVVAYEPPLFIAAADGEDDVTAQLRASADEGRPADAAERFLTMAGLPPEMLPMIKGSPDWDGMVSVAHTLWHDTTIAASITEDDLSVLGRIAVPVVLVDGADSPPWAHHATTTVAAAIVDAKVITVEGADHRAPEHLIAPLLIEHLV